MFKRLIFIPILAICCLSATTHNEPHKFYQALANAAIKEAGNCGELTFTRKERYSVDGVTGTGNRVVSVFVPKDCVVENIELTWTTPIEREDGSLLTLTEINSYEIHHSIDGVMQPLIVVKNDEGGYIIADPAPGWHTFYIMTVDTNQTKSDPSNTIGKTI